MKRYRPELSQLKNKLDAVMIEDENGKFIRYGDHLAILKSNETLIKLLTRNPNRVKELIEEFKD